MSALRLASFSATYQGASAAPGFPPTRSPSAARGCRTQGRDAPRAAARPGLDRALRILQIAAEEILEGTLADEADSGAVRLVEHAKSRGVSAAPHFVLAKLAERKQGVRERPGGDAVQEIALILRYIARLEEPGTGVTPFEPGVMAGGDAVGAEPVHVIQANPEFDLAVAEHVRVRRSTGGVFTQEMGENALAVLQGEAHPVQGDVQRLADGARILEVLGGGAIGIVVPSQFVICSPWTEKPASFNSSAATAESTPPDMPTMTVSAEPECAGIEGIRRL